MRYAVYFLTEDEPDSAVVIDFDDLQFFEAVDKSAVVNHMIGTSPRYTVEPGVVVHLAFLSLVD